MPYNERMKRRNKAKGERPDKRKKVDWNDAFLYYCTAKDDLSLPSYNDVALKYGVAKHTVERVGKRNKWVERRQDVGKKAIEEFEAQKEEKARELNQRQFKNLTEMEQVIMQTVKEMRKSQLTFLSGDAPIEEKLKALKFLKNQAFDLEKLSNAIKNVNNLQRIILGMATEISKQDINQTTKEVALTPEELKEMDEFNKKNNAGKKKEDIQNTT